MPVKNQRMIADFESQPLGHGMLALFDSAIHEFLDATAVDTHDMVMMHAVVQFEDRHTALEMMTGDEASGLELREYPVDGGESDFL
jgi:hypothetical protein